MPNIKSAKKRVKVTETKTLQNKMFRSQMKTDIKKYQAALAAGDMAAAQVLAFWLKLQTLLRLMKCMQNILHKIRLEAVWL